MSTNSHLLTKNLESIYGIDDDLVKWFTSQVPLDEKKIIDTSIPYNWLQKYDCSGCVLTDGTLCITNKFGNTLICDYARGWEKEVYSFWTSDYLKWFSRSKFNAQYKRCGIPEFIGKDYSFDLIQYVSALKSENNSNKIDISISPKNINSLQIADGNIKICKKIVAFSISPMLVGCMDDLTLSQVIYKFNRQMIKSVTSRTDIDKYSTLKFDENCNLVIAFNTVSAARNYFQLRSQIYSMIINDEYKFMIHCNRGFAYYFVTEKIYLSVRELFDLVFTLDGPDYLKCRLKELANTFTSVSNVDAYIKQVGELFSKIKHYESVDLDSVYKRYEESVIKGCFSCVDGSGPYKPYLCETSIIKEIKRLTECMA